MLEYITAELQAWSANFLPFIQIVPRLQEVAEGIVVPCRRVRIGGDMVGIVFVTLPSEVAVGGATPTQKWPCRRNFVQGQIVAVDRKTAGLIGEVDTSASSPTVLSGMEELLKPMDLDIAVVDAPKTDVCWSNCGYSEPLPSMVISPFAAGQRIERILLGSVVAPNECQCQQPHQRQHNLYYSIHNQDSWIRDLNNTMRKGGQQQKSVQRER